MRLVAQIIQMSSTFLNQPLVFEHDKQHTAALKTECRSVPGGSEPEIWCFNHLLLQLTSAQLCWTSTWSGWSCGQGLADHLLTGHHFRQLICCNYKRYNSETLQTWQVMCSTKLPSEPGARAAVVRGPQVSALDGLQLLAPRPTVEAVLLVLSSPVQAAGVEAAGGHGGNSCVAATGPSDAVMKTVWAGA